MNVLYMYTGLSTFIPFWDSGDVSANLQLHTPTVKSVQIHIYYTSLVTSEHVFLISGDVSANLQLNTPTVKRVQILIYSSTIVISEHEVTFRRSKCRFMIFLRPLTEKNEDFRLRKSTSIRAAGITLLSRECVTARYHTVKPYITFCEAEYITLLSRFCSRPA